MADGQAVRRVDLPASAVWAVLADHEGMATWGPGVTVTMEHPGDPDPAGVGAIRDIRGPAGVRIREEITAFEPERKLAYRALSGVPLPGYAGEVELAEHDGGTAIRWSLSSTLGLPGTGMVLSVLADGLLFALVHRLNAGPN